MIGCYGVGDVLHEDCLTGLWLCHDECALSLTDWREEIYDSRTGICCGGITAELEFLFGEEWSEMFK